MIAIGSAPSGRGAGGAEGLRGRRPVRRSRSSLKLRGSACRGLRRATSAASPGRVAQPRFERGAVELELPVRRSYEVEKSPLANTPRLIRWVRFGRVARDRERRSPLDLVDAVDLVAARALGLEDVAGPRRPSALRRRGRVLLLLVAATSSKSLHRRGRRRGPACWRATGRRTPCTGRRTSPGVSASRSSVWTRPGTASRVPASSGIQKLWITSRDCDWRGRSRSAGITRSLAVMISGPLPSLPSRSYSYDHHHCWP